MLDSIELQNRGLQEIYPPNDLWRNRFNEDGTPILDLEIRYLNLSSAIFKYLGDMQYHILLGGSSTNSSFIADEAPPQDFDWIVLVNDLNQEKKDFVDESDILTAMPEINPWMDDETREKLRFEARHKVAPQIQANKNEFNDVIIRTKPEEKKIYFDFENGKWYYSIKEI